MLRPYDFRSVSNVNDSVYMIWHHYEHVRFAIWKMLWQSIPYRLHKMTG